MNPIVIYSCSPRIDGNSDNAAKILAHEIQQSGKKCSIIHICDYNILPCKGCNFCATEGRCILEQKDDSQELLELLVQAASVVFTSPIYFYHLPAQFKALIDRSQSFYLRRELGDKSMLSLPTRRAWAVLCAGRPVGDKLFAGAELSMRYFLHTFNFDLQPSLNFRGIDKPDDLQSNKATAQKILDLGQSIGRV